MRWIRFFQHWKNLKSIQAALWVMDYEKQDFEILASKRIKNEAQNEH